MSTKIVVTTRDSAAFELNYAQIKEIPLLYDITENLVRQSDEATTVNLTKITGEQFGNVLQWLEQRQFNNTRQILQLLVAANYLLMDDLMEKASIALAQVFNQRNTDELMSLMLGLSLNEQFVKL